MFSMSQARRHAQSRNQLEDDQANNAKMTMIMFDLTLDNFFTNMCLVPELNPGPFLI